MSDDEDETVYTEDIDETDAEENVEEELLLDEIEEDESTSSNTIVEFLKGKCDTSEFLSAGETAAIISSRALQIAKGSPIFATEYMMCTSAIEIAKLELQQGKTPICIKRTVRRTKDGIESELVLVKNSVLIRDILKS